MTLGGLTGGWRVTRVLAEDVTVMSRHGSFLANAVTAILVTFGAYAGLPMSTTHVSSGGIIGLGVASGTEAVRWPTVRRMLAGWVITVPAAAILGALGVVLGRGLVGAPLNGCAPRPGCPARSRAAGGREIPSSYSERYSVRSPGRTSSDRVSSRSPGWA
jgi:hypothetical protein